MGTSGNVALRLIESGKPNQNAYVESFNGLSKQALVYQHMKAKTQADVYVSALVEPPANVRFK